MKYCVTIGTPYSPECSHNLLTQCSTLLAKGHSISTIFLWGEAVELARAHSLDPAWGHLSDQYNIELIVCSKSAEERSLSAPKAISSLFSIGGLGLLIEATLQAEWTLNLSSHHQANRSRSAKQPEFSELVIALRPSTYTTSTTGTDAVAVATVFGQTPQVRVLYEPNQDQPLKRLLSKLEELKEYGPLHVSLYTDEEHIPAVQAFLQAEQTSLTYEITAFTDGARTLIF